MNVDHVDILFLFTFYNAETVRIKQEPPDDDDVVIIHTEPAVKVRCTCTIAESVQFTSEEGMKRWTKKGIASLTVLGGQVFYYFQFTQISIYIFLIFPKTVHIYILNLALLLGITPTRGSLGYANVDKRLQEYMLIFSTLSHPNGLCVCNVLEITETYLIWARINHFEARMMVLSQKVDSKVLRMTITLKYFGEKKSKIATPMFGILDGFSLVWILMYQQSKSASTSDFKF